MELHFLEARVPLVKTYTKVEQGYDKTSYPMVMQVTSHLENVTSPTEFFAALKYHARNDHCLLKGRLSKKLDFESRAGQTNPLERTDWLCLDLDYLESESQVDNLLAQMGLSTTTYIMQYGAGHQIDKPFSAHLFFMLEREVLPEQLKYWLMHHNLNLPAFERSIQLSRSNAALRWPLDITVAHNHMLLYIAAPQCVGFEDPVKDGRIKLVEKDQDKIDLLDALNEIDSAVVSQKKDDKLNELRKAKGLKARKFSTKLISGIEVQKTSDVVSVTGQREARGFMYLNINNGDSWGYYHPTDNPEILYNFKGEPNYLTKELLPEYYKGYKQLQRKIQQEQKGELAYLAFLDRQTDQYFRGTYDPTKPKVEIFQTSSVKKVEDFLKQNSQYVPDYIDEWDYVFRFDDPRMCSPEERFLNRFQETPYLAEGRLAPMPKHFPPTIKRIIASVTGGNPEIVKRFLNWLAFIVQKRRKAETAWVFTGCQGTGKGLLMHRILSPLIGQTAVQTKLMSELEDKFNEYMEECVFLLIDEAEHKQLNDKSRTMARLKNAITDPHIPIRRMNTGHYTAKNYMNILIASNHRSAVAVEDTDRRFNVGDYQEERLQITDAEVDAIKDELFDFVSLLYKINVDESVLRTPLRTHTRDLMNELTGTAFGNVISALLQGDLQMLIDGLPGDRSPGMRESTDRVGHQYVEEMLCEAERRARRSERHFVPRDEIHNLISILCPESTVKSTTKFVQQVKHHGVDFTREGGELGLWVMWQAPEVGMKQRNKRLEAVK